MNYCVFRVEEGEKDCEATSQKLAIFISNLEVFNYQTSCTKLWIKGLLHQIHLMSNGSRILIAPLLVKSLNNLPASWSSVIVVMACPVCGFYFKENDIIVASCWCTYHPFFLAMFMEFEPNKCVEPACGKVFINHWINSFGFKQISFPMKRSKKKKDWEPIKAQQKVSKVQFQSKVVRVLAFLHAFWIITISNFSSYIVGCPFQSFAQVISTWK